MPLIMNKSTFHSLLFLVYISLSLLRFIWPDQDFNSVITTAIGLYALLSVRMDRRLRALIVTFVFILLISFFLSSMFNNRPERIVQSVFFILGSSGIALLLTTGSVSLWSIRIAFYCMAIYFFYLISQSTDPMKAIFSSQNGISQMMFAGAISFYIISNRLNRKIDLKPAFVTLLISIWAVGRSGILVSLVLLFGLMFLKTKRKLTRAIFLCSIVSIIIFMAIPFYGDKALIAWFYGLFDYSFSVNAILNYSKSFDSTYTGRSDIIGYYFQNLDIFRIFFGVNPRTEYWPGGEFLNYNYHNSFIQMHSQIGFFGLIIIILLMISFFKFIIDNKVYSLLILAFCLRWSTDSYLFFEFFDFIPFFFIFMAFKSIKKEMSTSSEKKKYSWSKGQFS